MMISSASTCGWNELTYTIAHYMTHVIMFHDSYLCRPALILTLNPKRRVSVIYPATSAECYLTEDRNSLFIHLAPKFLYDTTSRGKKAK